MRTEGKLSVYESLIHSIKRDISLGIYAEGERLPSCRDMALKLGINPNTVQRAYSELEAQGVIYTIPKKGVYIKAYDGAAPQPGNTSNIKEIIEKFKQAGLSRQKIIEIINEVYKND